jgi:hypothetical protein
VFVSDEDIDGQTCAAIASRIKLDVRLFSTAIGSGAVNERVTASAAVRSSVGLLASRLFLSDIGCSGATIVSCCWSTTSPSKAVAKSGDGLLHCMSPVVAQGCRQLSRVDRTCWPT